MSKSPQQYDVLPFHVTLHTQTLTSGLWPRRDTACLLPCGLLQYQHESIRLGIAETFSWQAFYHQHQAVGLYRGAEINDADWSVTDEGSFPAKHINNHPEATTYACAITRISLLLPVREQSNEPFSVPVLHHKQNHASSTSSLSLDLWCNAPKAL